MGKCDVVVKMGAISNTHLEFRLAPAKEFYNIGGSGWCLAVRDVSANGTAIVFKRGEQTLTRRLTKDSDTAVLDSSLLVFPLQVTPKKDVPEHKQRMIMKIQIGGDRASSEGMVHPIIPSNKKLPAAPVLVALRQAQLDSEDE